MKRIALLIAALALTACRSESENLGDGKAHPCIGINGVKDSTLVYEYSARNIVLGVVFAEIIVPPVVVLLNKSQCPVAIRSR